MSELKQAWEYSFTHSSATDRGDEEIGPLLTYDKKLAFGIGCIKQREVFVGTQPPEAVADKVDAERYRFLRGEKDVTVDNGMPWVCRLIREHGIPTSVEVHGAMLDVVVDAARQANHTGDGNG